MKDLVQKRLYQKLFFNYTVYTPFHKTILTFWYRHNICSCYIMAEIAVLA